MDLLTGLYAGRESLISHGTALAVVADNVANSNTTGYKAERTEFAGLLANSMGSMYSDGTSYGDGVQVTDVVTMQSQGSIETTSQQLDFAVKGEGFFIVSDGTNTYYTRAGNFTTDANGYLVTQGGLSVMGYAQGDDQTLVPLQVTNSTVDAQPTTTATLSGILDSSSKNTTVPTNPQTFSELNDAATYRCSFSIIDSLGESRDISMYFFKTDNSTWQASAYVDGATVGGTEGSPTQIGTTTLSFASDGSLVEGSGSEMTMTGNWGGTSSSSVTVNLANFNAVASNSALSTISTNGTKAGTVSSISVADDGTITGVLNSGSETELGTVALAQFINPNSLERMGTNLFTTSEDTATPSIGTPDSGARGSIANGSLESSTVDQATEFINMVRYQRGYQAGSQVVSTMSSLINTTLELA